MPFWWGRKKKEHAKLEEEVASLEKQQRQLEQTVQGHRLETEQREQRQQIARIQAQSEHEAQRGEHNAELQKNHTTIATLRSRIDTGRLACDAYREEVENLAGAGLEPRAMRVLVEAWETGDAPRLLGEQWLDVDLSASHAPKQLKLAPRLLLARPALGKSEFGSVEHVTALGLNVQLSFDSRPSGPKPAAAPQEAAAAEHAKVVGSQRESFLLDHFKVGAAAHGSGKSSPEKTPSNVVLCLWTWGQDCGGTKGEPDVTPTAKTQRRQVRQVAGHAALATTPLPLRAPPPSLPAAVSQQSPGAMRHGKEHSQRIWHLNVITLDGWTKEQLKEHLKMHPAENHSVSFPLEPGSEPMVLGRLHRIIQVFLTERPELLACISRRHLQFTADPDGAGLHIKNLSRNTVAVNNHLLANDDTLMMFPGDQFSFMKPAALDSDTSPVGSSAGKHAENESSPFLDTRMQTPASQASGPPIPILTLQLLDGSDDEESEEDVLHDCAEDDFIHATLSPQANAGIMLDCARKETGNCIGFGGDVLYRFVDSSSKPVVYCAACSASLQVSHPEMCKMMPRVVQPARWDLLFQSEPAQVMDLESGEWQADFAEQQVSVEAPRPHALASTDDLHKQRGARFALRRTEAKAESERHAGRAVELQSEASELDKEARVRSEFADEQTRNHVRNQMTLSASVQRLREEASTLQAEMRAAHVAAQQWYADEAATEAEAEARAERAALFAEQQEAERRERMKDHRKLRKGAVPLEPPPNGRCPGGGSRLGNHQRFLQLLYNNSGLLYRDAWIEVQAVVHRPAGLFEASPSGTPLRAPPVSPSHYHNHPALSHSLWAEVCLSVRARSSGPKGSAAKTRLSSSPTGKDADAANVVGFQELRLDLGDYDVLEIDFEKLQQHSSDILSDGTTKAPRASVEQTIRCELLDFIAGHPSLSITAQLLSQEPQSDHAPVVKEHSCKLMMPVGITTFLRPLSETEVFEDAWSRNKMEQPVKLSLPSPLQEGNHRRRQSPGSPSSASSMSLLHNAAPGDAVASSKELMAVVSYGGAFRCFQLAGGTLGLGAQLPPHGCHDEVHAVLLKVSLSPGASTEDGKKTRIGDESSTVWEIAAVSVDRHLAQAALAAVATQLKCLPADTSGQAPTLATTPLPQAGVQQAGG